MNEQAFFIATGSVGLVFFISRFLKPPEKTCNIRDVQFMIALAVLFWASTYRFIQLVTE